MAEVEQIKNLLERDWAPTVTGRTTDVPDPGLGEIVWTLEKKDREARLNSRDVGYITSGADANYTPNGLGWNAQDVDTAVVIEYRAITRTHANSYDDAYNRLHGQPTGANGVGAPDSWDGVTGETRRVILDNRKRTGGWTRLGTDGTGASIQVRDLQDLGGNKYYRADVWIPMDAIGQIIDTSV